MPIFEHKGGLVEDSKLYERLLLENMTFIRAAKYSLTNQKYNINGTKNVSGRTKNEQITSTTQPKREG